MQYAEILLNQKTKQWDDTFTYAIAPEILPYVKEGSYVLVPFGKQKEVEGVVVKLKKSVAPTLRYKLKTISKIVQADFQIAPDDLDFAKWLANTFYASWGEALFAFIPPVPRKKPVKFGKIEYLKRAPVGGNHILIIGSYQKRFAQYLKAINRIYERGQSSIVIFADNNYLEDFAQFLAKTKLRKDILKYGGEGKVNERFENWLKSRESRRKIILGTRMAVLNPAADTALIIIDEPLQEGHREEQAPRYNSREVAEYWRANFGMSVIEGDLMPSLEHIKDIADHNLTVITEEKFPSKVKISLVNTNQEREPLSAVLQEEVERAVKRQEKVLIFVPHRGFGKIIKCLDCEYEFRCPNCATALIYHAGKRTMLCHQCNYQQKLILKCPACGNVRIKSFGWSTEKVAVWLRQRYPGVKILPVDKDYGFKNISGGVIYVATQAVLRYRPRVNLTGILDFDWLLTKANYRSEEETLRSILELMSITQEKIIIQSQGGQAAFLEILLKRDYQNFLRQLANERKQYAYPPWGNLVLIRYDETSDEKAKRGIKNIEAKIKRNIKEAELLGPAPVYFHKPKNKHSWQLMIKTKKKIPAGVLRSIIWGNVHLEYNPPSYY